MVELLQTIRSREAKLLEENLLSQRASMSDGRELTPREKQVLELVLAGSSNNEIGDELGISPRTVEVHRASVMKKFGAKNLAQLMRTSLGG